MAETPLDHPVQPIGEPVGPAPGASEDDALPGPVALEQQQEQVKLLVGRDRDVVLLDRLDRDLVLRQVDLDRLVHVPMGQLPDVGIDRCRQQQRLPWGRQLAEDSLDVGPEPDVEHAIGLVEHDVNNIAQIKRSAFDVVEHAARGAHDQVDASRKCANLFFNRLAAENAANRHGGPHRQLLQLGDDLLRQLASRRQDDRLRTSLRGLRASRSAESRTRLSSLCPSWPGR